MLFVAERSGCPVALLSMAPVFARHGWLFEDLLRDPSAPNGTTERLVDAGMRAAAARGSRWATLGLAPLAGPVTPWLARVRRWATPFFNFTGLTQFKAKLRPATWAPIWMVHPAGTPTWRALLDALTAFAGGSLVRYGWRTLLRGPQPVLAAMAALLVPWTLVLATLDTSRWYPAPWVQGAWVGFDLVLCAAIAVLAGRWRQRLGVAVATAVTADVLVTSWQAVSWYVPRASGAAASLGAAIAVMAPALAAAVLWGRVRRGVQMRPTSRP
jgi:phosphatidylglycerol lysyltransferase